MTTIQPRIAVVTVYQGDYLDRIRHLERQYESAIKSESNTARTLGEVTESHQLAEDHAALIKEADKSAVQITVQALPRKVWRALVAAHPARDGNDNDAIVGVHEDDFKEALTVCHGKIDEYDFQTIVNEDLTDQDIEGLSDGDFDRIYLTAFALNRGTAASPKALKSPVSQANPESDET